MTRLEANREILKNLSNVVEKEPDWRFHQILQNIGIEIPGSDQWYEESEETFNNIMSLLKNMDKCIGR